MDIDIKELQQIAAQKAQENEEQAYQDLLAQITARAMNGKFELYKESGIYESSAKRLKELGFTINKIAHGCDIIWRP